MSHHSAHIRVPQLFENRASTHIKSELTKINGIKNVDVNSSVNRVLVEFNSDSVDCNTIMSTIDSFGYNCELISQHNHNCEF